MPTSRRPQRSRRQALAAGGGRRASRTLSAPLTFEHVDFSDLTWQERGTALADLNFTIRPTAHSPFSARPGSAKRAGEPNCRQLEPSAGRTTREGRDVADIDPRSRLRHVALAGQDRPDRSNYRGQHL